MSPYVRYATAPSYASAASAVLLALSLLGCSAARAQPASRASLEAYIQLQRAILELEVAKADQSALGLPKLTSVLPPLAAPLPPASTAIAGTASVPLPSLIPIAAPPEPEPVLLGIMQTGPDVAAEIALGRQIYFVTAGQRLGSSGWSVVTVAPTSVELSRPAPARPPAKKGSKSGAAPVAEAAPTKRLLGVLFDSGAAAANAGTTVRVSDK